MEFEDWWKKQTENFDPEEIGTMQLARVAWTASRALENEACAQTAEVALRYYTSACTGVAEAIRARSNA